MRATTVPAAAGPRYAGNDFDVIVEVPATMRPGGIADCVWSSDPPGLGMLNLPQPPADGTVAVRITGGAADTLYAVRGDFTTGTGRKHTVEFAVPTR